MNDRPPLIAIEGIDGAGTTTQARLLHRWLVGRSVPAHCTYEPSKGPVGRLIRRVLRGETTLDSAALALLFAADRLDHLAREIQPALAAGQWVITDRYVYSSLAYQSCELDLSWVAAINARAPEPDLTIYLRVPAELAIARVQQRGGQREIYEHLEQQERIAAWYDQILGSSPADGAWIRQEQADGDWIKLDSASCEAGAAAGRRANVAIVDGSRPVAELQRDLQDLLQTVARLYRARQ